MNILFIEDNPDVYEPVKILLERKEHTVTVASDADSAVNEINSNLSNYNCIILDIMMMLGSIIKENEAEDTGIAIYKRIRLINKQIRVVVLSALSKGEIWRNFQTDVNAYYQEKPVLSSSTDFLRKIEGKYSE
jgi:CheY-like chemotaxis protein